MHRLSWSQARRVLKLPRENKGCVPGTPWSFRWPAWCDPVARLTLHALCCITTSHVQPSGTDEMLAGGSDHRAEQLGAACRSKRPGRCPCAVKPATSTRFWRPVEGRGGRRWSWFPGSRLALQSCAVSSRLSVYESMSLWFTQGSYSLSALQLLVTNLHVASEPRRSTFRTMRCGMVHQARKCHS